jgi:hypothetical protein
MALSFSVSFSVSFFLSLFLSQALAQELVCAAFEMRDRKISMTGIAKLALYPSAFEMRDRKISSPTLKPGQRVCERDTKRERETERQS